MAAKTYRKLIPNPIGLGRGVEIKEATFTDEGFHADNLSKLKLHIKAGRIEEVSTTAVDQDEEGTDEATSTSRRSKRAGK